MSTFCYKLTSVRETILTLYNKYTCAIESNDKSNLSRVNTVQSYSSFRYYQTDFSPNAKACYNAFEQVHTPECYLNS